MQAYKKSFESKSVDVEREKSEGENSGGKRTADGTMYITRWMGKKEAVKVFTGSCELESILLLAIVCFFIGKTDEAMQMHKKCSRLCKTGKV